MGLLSFLETTAFAEWVNTAMTGFPFIIALHSVGMAAIVGVSLIVGVNAASTAPRIRWRQLVPAIALARAGLLLNAVTGFALFASRGTEYIMNPAFLAKLALIVIGSVLSLQLFHACMRQSAMDEDSGTATLDFPRALAALSVLAWFGAVAAGRLIAYVSLLPGV